MLIDFFNRQISYVRISLTDRCNLRCIYCMPEYGINKLSHNEILTFENLKRLIKILKELNVTKYRFTGGEPFVRKGVFNFLEAIDVEFSVTTNLAIKNLDIERINNLNIRSINISCDSLNKEKYKRITRTGDLDIFLENFLALKIADKKINVVIIKNFNENEIMNFIEFGLKYNAVIRFIEKMDMIDDKLNFVSLNKIIQKLIKENIIENNPYRVNNSVALYYNLKIAKSRVGFITPISEPFCGKCNKIRIKANGDIKLCIFLNKIFNIREILNKNKDDEQVKDWIRSIVRRKPFQAPIYKKGNESMSIIGG